MRPLSMDLRERIIRAVDNKEGSRREIAKRFDVDTSTITRLLQLRRRTSTASTSSSKRSPTPRSNNSGRRWA